MGVYIENIHMPEDGEHPLWISLHSDGTVEYNANKGDGWQMTTAIPVPPHGDLIERDKLREKEFVHDGDAYAVVMARDIRNAPTIIPASEEGET